MAKRGIPGSQSALQRFFDRHNVSFKKESARGRAKRADVARARRRWMREQGMLDPARLVFIDETATSTNMVRLRGRCLRGERLVASVPHGHWKTITFVAGLRHDGIVTPFVIDGAMNGPIFLAYIEQCLAPTLGRRDIVIMDNLPSHKVAGVAEAIEAAGARVLYLPSYSPDLNPIELFLANSKRCYDKRLSERYPTSGAEFVCSFAQSVRKNAPISFDTQVMYQHEWEML
jgi:transposase